MYMVVTMTMAVKVIVIMNFTVPSHSSTKVVVKAMWIYPVLVQCMAGLLHLFCRLDTFHIMPSVPHK